MGQRRQRPARIETRRFIVVLNDNEWSIAKNVGAIASYLNNIVANPTYAGLHDKARRFIEAIAGNDETLMERYFEKGELDEDEMRTGLKAAMIHHHTVGPDHSIGISPT